MHFVAVTNFQGRVGHVFMSDSTDGNRRRENGGGLVLALGNRSDPSPQRGEVGRGER